MKKTLILLFALSGFAQADDHAMDTYYAYYGISTTNPPAVVAAMDKFNASECGQKNAEYGGFDGRNFQWW